MKKLNSSVKISLGVSLLFIFLFSFINDVSAYYVANSYDLSRGEVIDGSLVDTFSDNGVTLDIKWQRDKPWGKYRYRIKITFDFPNSRCDKLIFNDEHSVSWPYFFTRKFTIYYTDGDPVPYEVLSVMLFYEIPLDSSRYLDKVTLYAERKYLTSTYTHESYFDLVASNPI